MSKFEFPFSYQNTVESRASWKSLTTYVLEESSSCYISIYWTFSATSQALEEEIGSAPSSHHQSC